MRCASKPKKASPRRMGCHHAPSLRHPCAKFAPACARRGFSNTPAHLTSPLKESKARVIFETSMCCYSSGFFWVPEGSLVGFFVRHHWALELVCGADFSCKLTCGAGPGDLGGFRGRVRPKIQGKPARQFPARLTSSTQKNRKWLRNGLIISFPCEFRVRSASFSGPNQFKGVSGPSSAGNWLNT